MKVLQINTTVNSGSTGRIAEGIGQVLLDVGHKSIIAYGRNANPSQSQSIKIGSQKDIYIHGIRTLLFDRHGFGSHKATIDLIQEIERFNPDIFLLHNLHGYYLNVDVLFTYLNKKKAKVIWTFHDCWPFTGHCTYFDSVGCEKWKVECHHCPKTTYYPKSLGLDNSLKNYHDKKRLFTSIQNLTIVTPSFWLANYVSQSFLSDAGIKVIHNGVDLNTFVPHIPQTQIENPSKVILGVASTWDERKGLKDFVKLRSYLPEDYEITLIGLSPKQIKALPSGIQGIARTEDVVELAEWYAKALCFINPTYQDNFPTTNIEALACGTPVITYQTGGSPEAINEETGRVVEKGDINGLVKAIYELEKEDRVKLRTLCRKRAESKFDQRNCYKEYLDLFNELIKKNKA